jgi:pyruvate/2-oxoglutarate dehydrogenase complex dihydrolipoamide dehydrogenase (E3) component
MPQFDVVVLGGGTAGAHVASEVARAGRTVAVVEAGLVGGESPYLACMPSKSLLQSSRRGETWEHAVARRDEVSGHLDDAVAAARLTQTGATLIRGTAQITKPGTIEVEEMATIGRPAKPTEAEATTIAYTDLVIATGSEPVAPPVEGLTDVPAWTSAEALTGPDLPRRLIVLGGGPVGCELAQIYASFGSAVTLVEAEDHVLPGETKFAGELLADGLRRTGVDVRAGSAAVKAETTDSGLALTLADGSRLEADRVLLATGRRPRLSGLGLAKLGIELGAGMVLPVDSGCRVSTGTTGGTTGATGGATGATGGGSGGRGRRENSGQVWAAGDVTGVAAYTHTANYQADIVAANILGGQREADYRAIPRVVYTTPSVYTVGLSPARAQAAGVELVTAGFDLAETARATVEDDDKGRVELYADASGVLVGAAAVGLYAEEWMSEVTLAVRAGIPLSVLADVVRAFPTYGAALESPLRKLAGTVTAVTSAATSAEIATEP